MVSLRFQHSLEELARANRLLIDHSPTLRRRKKLVLTFVGIVYFLFGIWVGNRISSNAVIIIGTGVLLLLVIKLLTSWITHWIEWWSVRKMLCESSNKALFSERETMADEQGLIVKSELGESKVQWGGIERVVESKEFALFYVSSLQAIVVPKQNVISGVPAQFIEEAKRFWLSANPDKRVEISA